MKHKISDSTYLLTLASLFCSVVISGTAQAQRTSGDYPGGRIVDTTNQGQILMKDLDNIEAHCMNDVIGTFLTPALMPGLTLTVNKVETKRDRSEVQYVYTGSSDVIKTCSFAYSARSKIEDSLSPKFIGNHSIIVVLNPTCLKLELRNEVINRMISAEFFGVPYLTYKITPEWTRNGLGVPVATGNYFASEIAVVEQDAYASLDSDNSDIRGIGNKIVFFRYPKSQYVACLRDGLNKLGQSTTRR